MIASLLVLLSTFSGVGHVSPDGARALPASLRPLPLAAERHPENLRAFAASALRHPENGSAFPASRNNRELPGNGHALAI